MARLKVYFLRKDPRSFNLDRAKPVTIGRGRKNTVVLDDPKSSRDHARIFSEEGHVYIEDLESTNGVSLNGEKTAKAKLYSGDEIIIGDTRLVYTREETLSSIFDIQGDFEGVADTSMILSSRIEQVWQNLQEKVAGERGCAESGELLSGMEETLQGIVKTCQELERSYQILYTLYNLNNAVGSVYQLDELLSLIMDMVLKMMKAERGFLMLYNRKTRELVPAVELRMKVDDNEENQGISHSISNQVIETGESVITTDAMMDPRFREGMSIVNMNIRSVMCVPLKTSKGIIGVLYVDNRQSSQSFNRKDLKFLEGFAGQAAQAIEKTKLYEDLEKSYLASIEVLANVLDATDPYTHGHSMRVSYYSVAIAKEMGLSEEKIRNLRYGSLLHDIGKVGIPYEIISKPGRLTEQEYEKIRKHPAKGFEIIRPIKFLEEKLAAIKYHHERFDGKGYPQGLSGNAIPVEARIAAVADAFDAMTSTRSYRRARGFEAALLELQRNAGTQFDPEVVKSFLKIARRVYAEVRSSIDLPDLEIQE